MQIVLERRLQIWVTQNVCLVERLIYDVLNLMEIVRVKLSCYLGRPSDFLCYQLAFSSGHG